MASVHTLATIAALLDRSEMAVRLKLKSLNFEPHDLAGFKAKDLAELLHVTIRQVRRWRQKGYLVSVHGRITEESFSRFCRTHGDKIPVAEIDEACRLWLRGYGFRTD